MQVKLYTEDDTLYYQIIEVDESLRGIGKVIEVTVKGYIYELYSCNVPDISDTTLYIHGDNEHDDYDVLQRIYGNPAKALEKFTIYKTLLEKAGVTVLNYYGKSYVEEKALKKEKPVIPKEPIKRLGRDDFLSKIGEIT